MKSKHVLLIITGLVIMLGLSAWRFSWGSKMTSLTEVQSPGMLDEQAGSSALLLTATPKSTEEGEVGVGETEEAEPIRGNITGTVVNGSGGEIPEGLEVTLLIHMESATEITTVIDPDGSFLFEGIELVTGNSYIAAVEYLGIPYYSDFTVVEPGDTSLEISISIYEPTTDTSNLTISIMHVAFDFSEPDFVWLSYEILISNFGNEIVVSSTETEPTVRFAVPEEATNLVFEEGYGIGITYVPTEDGFGDPSVISPGEEVYAISYAFRLPYDGGIEWVQPSYLPIQVVILYLQDLGLEIESSMFFPYETGEGMPYQILVGELLSEGGELRAKITGDIQSSSTGSAVTPANNRTTTTIILGVVGFAMIGAGLWWWMRPSKAVDDAYLDDDSPDAIMDEIIALDADHETGRIDEAEYLEEREALKERLKDALKD